MTLAHVNIFVAFLPSIVASFTTFFPAFHFKHLSRTWRQTSLAQIIPCPDLLPSVRDKTGVEKIGE